jgi:hypothetical protein
MEKTLDEVEKSLEEDPGYLKKVALIENSLNDAMYAAEIVIEQL